MSAYIKLSTLEYPLHVGDIAIDPAGADDYAHVEWTNKPVFDPLTQLCVAGKPETVDGVWRMTWVVRDKTTEEIAADSIPFNPFSFTRA